MSSRDDGKGFTLIEGLKGKLPQEDEQLSKLIKLFKDNIEKLVQLNTYQAQIKKAYFDSLIKEGFTEEQALKVVMNDLGKT